MEPQITAYLIDPETKTAKLVTITDSLECYYPTLHCDLIDIVDRRIGGKRYTIICDDEALLRDDPLISAIGDLGNPMLVGALLVVNSDRHAGTLLSLEQSDIDHISKHIHHHGTRRHPEGWPMLCQVNW